MLVLAMEFSRGARCRPWYSDGRTKCASGRRANGRRRLHGSSDRTESLPQNGTVRSDDHADPVYGAGPGRSLEGNETDAAAAENARAPNNQ